jgi:hypothetical protein
VIFPDNMNKDPEKDGFCEQKFFIIKTLLFSFATAMEETPLLIEEKRQNGRKSRFEFEKIFKILVYVSGNLF